MFLNYINNLRGFIIIFIVGFHSFWLVEWNTPNISFSMLHSFFQGSSTYFLFISGFLFQHLLNRFHYLAYLRKKFLYVVLPYLLISIPMFIKLILIAHTGFFENYPPYIQPFLYYMTGVHISPFWFIPMIVLFYFCAPIFVYIDKNPQWYKVVLPLLILISQIVLRKRGMVYSVDKSILPLLSGVIQSFIHFLSIYVLGMFCSHYKQILFERLKHYIPLLIIMFISLWGLEVYCKSQIFDIEQHIDYFKSIIFLLIILYSFWRYDSILGRKLALIGEMSFGIFFIHEYVNWVIWRLELSFFKDKLPGHLWTQLLVLSISIALCMSLLTLVKYIFGRNSRLLVGY